MRKNDKTAAVRLKLVESAKGLLVNLHDHRETVDGEVSRRRHIICANMQVELMRLKLLDPDEKVRAAVCKVYSQLDYETVLHYVSEDQLRSIAGRGMDKKVCNTHPF